MKIKTFNADFGNSFYMNMVDSYYFDLPTNVVEISKERADGIFTTSIEEPEDLKGRLMISTSIEGTEKYYLVGAIAENEIFGNDHIKTIHNKIESEIPYITFLGAAAYYVAIKDQEATTLDIEYFQSMLPIWLLKKAGKFSESQEAMANRFKGEHTVRVLTPGAEKELTITVEDSKCRIESEVARWAIKKNFDLEDNPEADQFKNHQTVLYDLGGGTDDAVLLPPGLKAPKSRDSFEFYTDLPYLKFLERLRKDKLNEHFSDVRTLDKFIVENNNKSKLELKNGNTGEKIDVTDTIHKALKEYAAIKLKQAESAFPPSTENPYKYVYIGGVAPILETALKEVAEELYGSEIAESNHTVHPDARVINLHGLEIIGRSEMKKRETAASQS